MGVHGGLTMPKTCSRAQTLVVCIAFHLALAVFALPGVARGGEFKIYHSTSNNVPATSKSYVPLTSIPTGVNLCLWTASNHLIWADPPTDAQVQSIARTAINGGPAPYAALDPAHWSGVTMPAGTLVMLDAEGRTDDKVNKFLDQYVYWVNKLKPAGTVAPPYCVYSFYPSCDPSMNFTWRAFNMINITRASEARAAATAKIVAKVPVLLLENYPQLAKDDNLVFAAWEFDIANARRLFPSKQLYAIARNDRGAAGSTEMLTPEQTERLALFLRSRYDGVIVWGDRAKNLPLMQALAAVK
jgi:hypothetical protein